MQSEEIQIISSNTVLLNGTLYKPATPMNIAVQINSAVQTPRAFYKYFAHYLAQRGITVLTYDYQGLVKPGVDMRQNYSAVTDWGSYDQYPASQWLKAHYPNYKYALIGHSIGGQIVGLNALAREFNAVLLVTSAHGYFARWPTWFSRWRRWLFWRCLGLPLINVTGFLPGKYFGMFNLPPNVGRQMRRFALQPRWLVDEFLRPLRPYNGDIACNLRYLIFRDDRTVPEGAQLDLNDFFPNANCQELVFNPEDFAMSHIGHFGFFRKSMPIAAWDAQTNWLIDRVTAIL